MILDNTLEKKILNVSIRAALASSYFVGKKDKISADKAAVDAMRSELNKIDMKGTVVIGEGELDEAPMIYIGEELGTNNGPELDIAVDPLEGTNFAANNLPGALSVISIARSIASVTADIITEPINAEIIFLLHKDKKFDLSNNMKIN